LPQTGASGVVRTVVVGLLTLQVGLILILVAARRPKAVGLHARRH
jgi:hypothetical protein